MSIIFVDAGDVWTDFDAGISIAHGCNLQGVMGAGIAKQVRDKFPKLYAGYALACQSKAVLLGDVYPYWVDYEPPKLVYNLMTQLHTGGASYDGIWTCLHALRGLMVKFETPILSMPQIGAGLGGLNWTVIKSMLSETFAPAEGLEVIVYESYRPAK